MGEKILKSRIINKHGTAEDWSKATNFIPMQGEIIVYDIDNTHNYERFKIGDGKTVASSLPFADDNKVDKVSGKGLSTNDYTTTEKNKLAGIDTGANKTVVDSALSATSTNPVQNKVVNTAISNIKTLVGDKSVATQISEAIETIEGGTVANATHATTADTATNANHATTADEADHATTADTATNANHAAIADKATQADSATKADSATNADYATSAGSADTAKSATKATQDGSGNVITSTYETKSDATSKLNTAKAYTDSEISEWVGDKTVASQINEAIQPMTIAEIDAICNMDDLTALVIAEYFAEATDSEGNVLTDNQDNTYVF